MTYPRTLRLTDDGVKIVVQRHTARAVATAALGAISRMTMNDANELEAQSSAFDRGKLLVVVLTIWIADEIGLSDVATLNARDFAAKKGIPRG